MVKRPVTAGWIALGVGVSVFTVVCVILGFWQLDRHEARAEEVAVLSSRLDREPVDLDALVVDDLPQAVADLVGWPVTVTGSFVADEQILVRGRALDGRPGSWLVAPLVGGSRSVAVVRGWVPLEVDDPDDPRVQPPAGPTTVIGITVAGEVPGRFTPEHPPGETEVYGILDLDRYGSQVGFDLGPVAVQQLGSEAPLEPLPAPDLDDPGPHLAYAVQWFGFALVGAVGYLALAGRQLGRGPFARRAT